MSVGNLEANHRRPHRYSRTLIRPRRHTLGAFHLLVPRGYELLLIRDEPWPLFERSGPLP